MAAVKTRVCMISEAVSYSDVNFAEQEYAGRDGQTFGDGGRRAAEPSQDVKKGRPTVGSNARRCYRC